LGCPVQVAERPSITIQVVLRSLVVTKHGSYGTFCRGFGRGALHTHPAELLINGNSARSRFSSLGTPKMISIPSASKVITRCVHGSPASPPRSPLPSAARTDDVCDNVPRSSRSAVGSPSFSCAISEAAGGSGLFPVMSRALRFQVK